MCTTTHPRNLLDIVASMKLGAMRKHGEPRAVSVTLRTRR